MRFAQTTYFLLVLAVGLLTQAHDGPVNDEGCHQNTHNEVLHCHRGRGKVVSLPKKSKIQVDKKIEIPEEFTKPRSIASIKQTMSDSQARLLEFECCVGANYLNRDTCQAFGFENWNKKKDCSRTPANLEYDLSQTVLKRVRCYECCTGEELLGLSYCADRGFQNWNKGNNCGCL